MSASAPRGAVAVVTEFLGCSEHADWTRAAGLLAPDLTRTGPDGAVVRGRAAYLALLQGLLGGITDYRYTVGRMVASADDRVVLVEIHEELTEADGTPVAVDEAMVFDVTADGRIAALSVYTKTT